MNMNEKMNGFESLEGEVSHETAAAIYTQEEEGLDKRYQIATGLFAAKE
jgi:hypothetical protein